MELADLKKQNEAEAAGDGAIIDALENSDNQVVDVPEELVKEADELVEGVDVEPELDEEGKPIEKPAEPWMDADGKPYSDVSAKTHIKMKTKLKGQVSDRNEENERLKAENARLLAEKTQPATQPTDLKRPVIEDFDTDEEYYVALDKYDDDRADDRDNRRDVRRKQTASFTQARETLDKAVEEHFERAGELIEKSGITSENYQKGDAIVRQAIESAMPKKGELVTNQMISLLGKGSEKVMYYIGINKAARNELVSLLLADQTGMKALVFLGEQKQRLNKPKKGTTNAPTPATQLKGEAPTGAKGNAAKKKYDAAHANGKGQDAYNVKKQARKDGIDVSQW